MTTMTRERKSAHLDVTKTCTRRWGIMVDSMKYSEYNAFVYDSGTSFSPFVQNNISCTDKCFKYPWHLCL